MFYSLHLKIKLHPTYSNLCSEVCWSMPVQRVRQYIFRSTNDGKKQDSCCSGFKFPQKNIYISSPLSEVQVITVGDFQALPFMLLVLYRIDILAVAVRVLNTCNRSRAALWHLTHRAPIVTTTRGSSEDSHHSRHSEAQNSFHSSQEQTNKRSLKQTRMFQQFD